MANEARPALRRHANADRSGTARAGWRLGRERAALRSQERGRASRRSSWGAGLACGSSDFRNGGPWLQRLVASGSTRGRCCGAEDPYRPSRDARIHPPGRGRGDSRRSWKPCGGKGGLIRTPSTDPEQGTGGGALAGLALEGDGPAWSSAPAPHRALCPEVRGVCMDIEGGGPPKGRRGWSSCEAAKRLESRTRRGGGESTRWMWGPWM